MLQVFIPSQIKIENTKVMVTLHDIHLVGAVWLIDFLWVNHFEALFKKKFKFTHNINSNDLLGVNYVTLYLNCHHKLMFMIEALLYARDILH